MRFIAKHSYSWGIHSVTLANHCNGGVESTREPHQTLIIVGNSQRDSRKHYESLGSQESLCKFPTIMSVCGGPRVDATPPPQWLARVMLWIPHEYECFAMNRRSPALKIPRFAEFCDASYLNRKTQQIMGFLERGPCDSLQNTHIRGGIHSVTLANQCNDGLVLAAWT